MASIDYGVIAKKNGKIVNTEMFTEMIDTLGFKIEKDTEGYDIDGNYSLYLGDKDFFIAIYKGMIKIYKDKNKLIETIYDIDYYNPNSKYSIYRYIKEINGIGIIFNIKRLHNENRYKLTFHYKGDRYDVIYGYGVDLNPDYWYDTTLNQREQIKKWIND